MLDLPHSREYFAALFDAVGSRPVPAFRSSQPEVVRGMVANGLGYSLLNFPLKSNRTVDGEEFVIKRFKDNVNARCSASRNRAHEAAPGRASLHVVLRDLYPEAAFRRMMRKARLSAPSAHAA
jgi:LysR substrate binding domain.